MPQRFLKPGIVTSLRLAQCLPWAQLLFYKLISLVDDYGRFDAHPMVVGRAAFPYGDNRGRLFKDEQLRAMLQELSTARLNDVDEPCLTLYTVDGSSYLLLHRWTERLKFQNGKYPGSRYPSPEKDAQVWQSLSNDVKSRQSLSKDVQSCKQLSSPTTTPTTTTAPLRENGSRLAGEVAASRTRAGLLIKAIRELDAVPREARTLEQREDLKKKRAELDKIQKKQTAGDFTP